MKNTTRFFLGSMLLLFLTACDTTQNIAQVAPPDDAKLIPADKMGGGSSGMTQITDSTYLLVYDLKIHEEGPRLAILTVNDEAVTVDPVRVDFWDEDGLASDLESVCAIPGRDNEFLVAESGNWQGKLGRIFHLKLDAATLQAEVLGSSQLPMLQRNDFDMTGDQYEGIYCLSYKETVYTVLLAERGGSPTYPNGIIRWGTLDLNTHSLVIVGAGLKGASVNAPGNWTISKEKRSITDLHVDRQGNVWAAASEDQGDSGPFYSVIYQLGELGHYDPSIPISIPEEITHFKEIDGFKLEALSGPRGGIQSTHSFGTEDEIYGGIWRPIQIDFKN